MMRFKPRSGIATLCLLGSFAASEALAASVEQLVQAGKYKQAYLQGQKQLQAREGDPGFDLAYAEAALRSGDAEAAVLALDRVLIVEPGNTEARLLLAEALGQTGGTREARSQLDMISHASPEQMQRIDALMARLDAAAARDAVSYKAWLDLALGHDSNLNFGSRHSATDFPGLGPFFVNARLLDAAKNQSAWYNRNSIGGSYYRQLDDSSAVDAVASLSHKNNMGEGFDQRAWRLNAGYSTMHQGDRVRVALRYEQDDVSAFAGNDRERLRYLWGVVGQMTSQGTSAWNRGWETTLTTGIAKVEYPSQRLRDVNQYMLGYEGRKTRDNVEHTLRGFYIVEDPDNGAEFNGRQVFTLSWRAEHQNIGAWKPWVERNLPGLKGCILPLLDEPITPFAQLGYTRLQYQDDLDVFQETREDNLFDASMGARWKVGKGLNLRANYRFRYTDSSINIYEYDRNLLEIGLRYQFL